MFGFVGGTSCQIDEMGLAVLTIRLQDATQSPNVRNDFLSVLVYSDATDLLNRPGQCMKLKHSSIIIGC